MEFKAVQFVIRVKGSDRSRKSGFRNAPSTNPPKFNEQGKPSHIYLAKYLFV